MYVYVCKLVYIQVDVCVRMSCVLVFKYMCMCAVCDVTLNANV